MNVCLVFVCVCVSGIMYECVSNVVYMCVSSVVYMYMYVCV